MKRLHLLPTAAPPAPWGGKPGTLAAQQAHDLELRRSVTRDIKVD